jgi:hypothetical protein
MAECLIDWLVGPLLGRPTAWLAVMSHMGFMGSMDSMEPMESMASLDSRRARFSASIIPPHHPPKPNVSVALPGFAHELSPSPLLASIIPYPASIHVTFIAPSHPCFLNLTRSSPPCVVSSSPPTRPLQWRAQALAAPRPPIADAMAKIEQMANTPGTHDS